jgi:hypothetical protein
MDISFKVGEDLALELWLCASPGHVFASLWELVLALRNPKVSAVREQCL